jgi:hypothetical protein
VSKTTPDHQASARAVVSAEFFVEALGLGLDPDEAEAYAADLMGSSYGRGLVAQTALRLAVAELRAAVRARLPKWWQRGTTTYWYNGQPISRGEYRALGGDDS